MTGIRDTGKHLWWAGQWYLYLVVIIIVLWKAHSKHVDQTYCIMSEDMMVLMKHGEGKKTMKADGENDDVQLMTMTWWRIHSAWWL